MVALEFRIRSIGWVSLKEQAVFQDQTVLSVYSIVSEFVGDDYNVLFRRVVQEAANEEAKVVLSAEPFIQPDIFPL